MCVSLWARASIVGKSVSCGPCHQAVWGSGGWQRPCCVHWPLYELRLLPREHSSCSQPAGAVPRGSTALCLWPASVWRGLDAGLSDFGFWILLLCLLAQRPSAGKEPGRVLGRWEERCSHFLLCWWSFCHSCVQTLWNFACCYTALTHLCSLQKPGWWPPMSPRRPCNLPLSLFHRQRLADGPCLRGCNSYDYVITSCGSISFPFFFLVKLVLSGAFFIQTQMKEICWQTSFQAVFWVLTGAFPDGYFCMVKHISVYFVHLVFRFWDLKHGFWLRIHMPGKLSNLEAMKHKHTLKYTICDWFNYMRDVILVSKWKNIAVILGLWHEVAAIMLSAGDEPELPYINCLINKTCPGHHG